MTGQCDEQREVGAPRDGSSLVRLWSKWTPLTPFTAGHRCCPPHCCCPPQAEGRPRHTHPAHRRLPPAGWYSSPSCRSSPSCLQLGGGNPRTRPCRLLIHQGACRPLDPPRQIRVEQKCLIRKFSRCTKFSSSVHVSRAILPCPRRLCVAAVGCLKL